MRGQSRCKCNRGWYDGVRTGERQAIRARCGPWFRHLRHGHRTHGALYEPTPRPVELVENLLNDVAAPLFALIIGVTITLTAPAAERAGSAETSALRRRYRLQTAVKAGVLIALGFLLEFAPSGVNIVLDYLGVMLLVMIPLLFLSNRTLIIVAAAIVAIGPALVTLVRQLAITAPTLIYPQNFFTVVLDWFVLGTGYQVPIFVAMGLAGLVIGRTILRNRRALLIVLVVSVIAFIPPKIWKMRDLPGYDIRGNYPEVLNETALAIGLFALILLLTDLASSRLRRFTVPIFTPFVAPGRMALSVYVFHVLILMWIVDLLFDVSPVMLPWFTWPRGLAIQIGLVVLCWAFAAAWSRWVGVGPLERVIGVLSGRHRLAASRRSTQPPVGAAQSQEQR
ncbi:MAG: DUF418 domain-containing protein [Leucobacter sp.]